MRESNKSKWLKLLFGVAIVMTFIQLNKFEVRAASVTITFNNQGATTAGTTSVSATNGMALQKITVPKKTGYYFNGYYTGANGTGTLYYNPDGTGARNWDKATDTTLCANWIVTTHEWNLITRLNSFNSILDSSGNVEKYVLSVGAEQNRNSRNVQLLCTPEQYKAALEADEIFNNDSIEQNGSNYYLPTDSDPFNKGVPLDPNQYEGVLSNILNDTFNGGNVILNFTQMQSYADSSKGLDTSKSYTVFFTVRTAKTDVVYSVIRNVGPGKKAIATLLPITINLKKENPDGTYTDKVMKTHVVEGNTVSYDTWPVEEIAGAGYHVNLVGSSGAGIVAAVSGEGNVATSSRKAQDINILYDLDERTVTFNANGGKGGVRAQTVLHGGKATEPTEVYTRKGFIFQGWSTNNKSTTADFNFTTRTITQDTTLYAVWKRCKHENLYTITIRKKNSLQDGIIKYACDCGYYYIRYGN